MKQRKKLVGCAALAAACLACAAQAQTSPDTPTTDGPPPIRGFEAYVSRHNVDSGFPDWKELGVRGSWQAGPHLLQGELASMKRWDESGTYAAIGDTYTFNEDWYGSLTLGAGDGASYLPRYRVDAFIHRKLLEKKNLVGSLGAGYYRAPDGHIDRNVSLGATYYFEMPLVVQGEVKFTHGSPGSVDTRQHFLAATWGREKQTTLTGRYGWGEEGYQSIGGGAVLTRFRSKELSFNLRHWLGRDWGLEAAVEHYRNPFYRRNGVTAGLFWQIP